MSSEKIVCIGGGFGDRKITLRSQHGDVKGLWVVSARHPRAPFFGTNADEKDWL